MWMVDISVDLIQMVYYHADRCAISPSAFLLKLWINIYAEFTVQYTINLRNIYREFAAKSRSWTTTKTSSKRLQIAGKLSKLAQYPRL